MKGMKRKFFLKRMWNFVVVMLIPALLLVAVTTYMTLVTQMHRMTQDNERGIEAVRSNISLVLDSVLAQNSYMTGMTRTNMVLNKALKRESLAYTDAIYLRSLVSSLNGMTNAYDYVDSVLIYMDGYDRALTSSGLVNLSADDYSGWYSVYSSMSDTERTCIAPYARGIHYSEDGGKSWADLPADCVVSMNLWGFTPAYVQEAKAGFAAFLQASLPVNPMKCEYYLPTVVTNALEAGKADVHVLTSADKWHGITYREDKPELVEALKKMSEDGLYPVDRLF